MICAIAFLWWPTIVLSNFLWWNSTVLLLTTFVSVGGIVRRKRSRELRFGEFAPESSAFFGVKNCENGSKTFEVIWIYYDRARSNLTMSFTISKTKTRRIKCNSFHFLKLQQIKMNYIGNTKTCSSSSSLVITSRWFATSRLRAPVSVRLVYSPLSKLLIRRWFNKTSKLRITDPLWRVSIGHR